jgi:predicted dehydrogenase
MTSAEKYSVAIYGTGKRGKAPAEAFHQDERFQVVAICGRDQERLQAAARRAGNPETYDALVDRCHGCSDTDPFS